MRVAHGCQLPLHPGAARRAPSTASGALQWDHNAAGRFAVHAFGLGAGPVMRLRAEYCRGRTNTHSQRRTHPARGGRGPAGWTADACTPAPPLGCHRQSQSRPVLHGVACWMSTGGAAMPRLLCVDGWLGPGGPPLDRRCGAVRCSKAAGRLKRALHPNHQQPIQAS